MTDRLVQSHLQKSFNVFSFDLVLCLNLSYIDYCPINSFLQLYESDKKYVDFSHNFITVKQIRRVFEDNLDTIFVTFRKNICYGYSPCRGDSNEYPQHTFLWRTVQKYAIKGVH